MGEGSVQSARVHRLVNRAFVDQVSDIKKRTFTTKSKHVTDISKVN